MIEDEIPLLTEKDFYLHALSLPLSGMFFPDNIPVSYEEYLEQKKQAETFACLHPNYHLTTSSSNPFQNLQIIPSSEIAKCDRIFHTTGCGS